MNAIAPYAQIMDITIGVNVLEKIEWIGRTCYKSTDMIKEGSAEKFVANLIKRGHEAMLEHASFCFLADGFTFASLASKDRFLEETKPEYKSFLRYSREDRFLVSGNVRAWRNFFKVCKEHFRDLPTYVRGFVLENPILFPEYQTCLFSIGLGEQLTPIRVSDLQSVKEFLTHCDVTARFVVDRGISHEIVRHRPASFAQESTRYCNYSKDKFGNQITFIIPYEFKYGSVNWYLWKDEMEAAERAYFFMIKNGVTPEWARTVLPSSLKTELIMTTNCAEWRHFFELRACNVTGKAHPQMSEVVRPLLDEFKRHITIVFDDLNYEKEGV